MITPTEKNAAAVVIVETPNELLECVRCLSPNDILLVGRSYFTVWIWFIILFVPFLFSRGARLILVIIVGIGGTYLANVHPREFVYGNVIVRKKALFFLDLMLHLLPLLLLVAWSDTRVNNSDCFLVVFIILLYLYVNDPIACYRLRSGDITVLGIGCALFIAFMLTYSCRKM